MNSALDMRTYGPSIWTILLATLGIPVLVDKEQRLPHVPRPTSVSVLALEDHIH